MAAGSWIGPEWLLLRRDRMAPVKKCTPTHPAQPKKKCVCVGGGSGKETVETDHLTKSFPCEQATTTNDQGKFVQYLK